MHIKIKKIKFLIYSYYYNKYKKVKKKTRMYYKCHEWQLVTFSYAFSSPWAVMIITIYTNITVRTVVRITIPFHSTCVTVAKFY